MANCSKQDRSAITEKSETHKELGELKVCLIADMECARKGKERK